MARLKDLVWHSALRTRAAGEVEVDGAVGGGGLPTGMDYQVFDIRNDPAYVEDVGFLVPAGTDWSTDGRILGTLDVPPGVAVLMSFYLEISAPLADGDAIFVGEWPTPGNARGSWDWGAGVQASQAPAIVGKAIALQNLPNVAGAADLNDLIAVKSTPEVASVQQVGLLNNGPSVNTINIVHARAAFLVV